MSWIIKAEHEGWSNYETWAMALWLRNDRELAAQVDAMGIKAGDPYQLADELKNLMEPQMPEHVDVWGDLLNAAFGEIAWDEIAENFMMDKPGEGGVTPEVVI